MSYKALTHGEGTTSDSDHAEVRASPVEMDPNRTSYTMSPDLDLRSTHSGISRPRTVSRDGSGPMQCPTPDLQSLQGAYKNNVERLEESAERLSLASDIGEAIRQIREEQKLSDSRRSSILRSPLEDPPNRSALDRQVSNGLASHASNSIVETNSLARSGGFSPAAYHVSPRESVRSSRRNSVLSRSTSQKTRLKKVSEPEQEGKPLDSPMSTRFTPTQSMAQQEAISSRSPVAYDPYAAHQTSSSYGLDFAPNNTYNLDDILIPRTTSPEQEVTEKDPMIADEAPVLRPSTDTARQAEGLWSDFDGVHTSNQQADHTGEQEPIHRDSSRTPEQKSRTPDQQLRTPEPPGPPEGMVYYPAPVPMMLNLPQKLSKHAPAAVRDKRRTQMMGQTSGDARKSAAWLPGLSDLPAGSTSIIDDDRSSVRSKKRAMANIPPQLRATMFFDYPTVNQNVEIKGESAVATLDSILDAAAFAPVSAFTDHPFVGQAGAKIYDRPAGKRVSTMPQELRQRSSSGNLLTRKNSKDMLMDEPKKRNSLMSIGNYFGRRKSSLPHVDHHLFTNGELTGAHGDLSSAQRLSNDEQDDADEDAGEEHDVEPVDPEEESEAPLYDDQPTTLLAELQMRKQQQKKRTKQAATAFPDGMQSTLLQLDAVAQVQQKTRNQKRTLLAWEDPEANPVNDMEQNEDVPLGMLYPSQKIRREEEERPLGLIAQRHIEDNEPLSHRRARLRGEDPRKALASQADAMSFQEARDAEPESEDDDEHPGETLAQRLKRIKATQIPSQPSRVSGDFTSEILSQLGGLSPSQQKFPPPPQPVPQKRYRPSQPVDPEETLGQRRKRLQAEAAAAAAGAMPLTNDDNVNIPTSPSPDLPQMPKRHSMADILQSHPAAGAGLRTVSNELRYTPAPRTRNTSWAMQVNEQARLAEQGKLNEIEQKRRMRGGAGGPAQMRAGMGYGDGEIIGVSGERNDMIDRWRQSVFN